MTADANLPVLVLIEHNNFEMGAINLKVIGALAELQKHSPLVIDLLVIGHNCRAVAETAALVPEINRVMLVDAPSCEHHLVENLAPFVASIAAEYRYLLAPATTWGKNLLPRIAAIMDVQPITDVIAIENATTFKRPIYAGSGVATVTTQQSVCALSIRPSAFSAVVLGSESASITVLSAPADSGLSRFVEDRIVASARPELTAARVVVSGGRGLQSGENFSLLYILADKLQGAVGASRAAVDAGFVGNDMQVGQTGKIVAPELYIAVGLSGAVQHIAGMRDSKVVVAINKDPEAPIFQVADYGLVADLFDAVPELIKQL